MPENAHHHQNGHPPRQSPPGERSALDVLLRCFIGEIGAASGVVVARSADASTRVLAAWGLGGTLPWESWATDGLMGDVFDAPGARIETRNGDGAGQPPALTGLAAPIAGATGRLGAIYAGFTGPPPIAPDRLCWIADSYARLAALCMEGGEGLTAALMDSHTDRLTGCLSHEGLLDLLTTEIARAERQHHRLSCCFVDLDAFKTVNDRNGHLAGNRVLAATGNALRTGMRPYDAVGRFGGDEFVIVLPHTGAAAATRMVQRMRIRIGAQVAASTGIQSFVSAGVAEWQREDSPLDLLDAADRALIDAKRRGGARVSVAGSSTRRGGRGLTGLARTLMRRGSSREDEIAAGSGSRRGFGRTS